MSNNHKLVIQVGEDTDRTIEIVCFIEEEGARFSNGVFSSSVASGTQTVEDALAPKDDVPLNTALSDIGFRVPVVSTRAHRTCARTRC